MILVGAGERGPLLCATGNLRQDWYRNRARADAGPQLALGMSTVHAYTPPGITPAIDITPTEPTESTETEVA